ncbi:MAG: hypothetical protein AB4352_20460 [Hormoscilla sp.]
MFALILVPADPDALFTVIQIDDRGDLRYEYEGSLQNWVMGRILEMGLPTRQRGGSD